MPAEKALPPKHYSIGSDPATSTSRMVLRDRVRQEGPLGFPEFMREALYHPAHGYYGKPTGQIGRGGDFFTSVSVGPLFGKLLARRFLRWWQEAGSPAAWRAIECGAHDGILAKDLLEAINGLNPAAWDGLEYVICEPLPALRAVQEQTLEAFGGHVRLVAHPGDLPPPRLPGIIFGNELLDALPFHVIEWRENCWQECRVTIQGDNFAWLRLPIIPGSELDEATTSLGAEFPDGYRTEVRTNFKPFLTPLLASISHGLLIWPDYGFARPDYYHPDRRDGTLRTFSNHRASDDPLASPGEQDITAHVDFTAVALAAIDLGCTVAGFQSQGAWLTGIAREWLLEQERKPDAASLRQFQTLTHPAHLGRSFQVLELAWNEPAALPPSATDLRRLALHP